VPPPRATSSNEALYSEGHWYDAGSYPVFQMLASCMSFTTPTIVAFLSDSHEAVIVTGKKQLGRGGFKRSRLAKKTNFNSVLGSN